MKRFLHSVRLRLTLWYGGVLALVLAVFAVSVYIFVVRTAQTNIDQALQSLGQQADQVATQVHGKPVEGKKVPITQPHHQASILGYLILSQARVPSKAAKKGQLPANYPDVRLALRSGSQSCGTLSSAGVGKRIFPVRQEYCLRVVRQKGQIVRTVDVFASLDGVDKALERLRLALILGVPIALLLAGFGGWVLANRALEPVDRISRMARTITASDLSGRINLKRQDELGRLAGTFDEMFDRLERAFKEQRQLTADVSHELRSPLTILEAQTSLALRRSRTSGEYRQVLASVQEEVDRMSSMVNQLLTLARADAGEEQIQLEPVDLAIIAGPVVEGMQVVAEERGVSLRLLGQTEVWVEGDAVRLRHLLLNLLDNALGHTPAGGTVTVRIDGSDRVPTLTVSDTGEGISPEDLPHIFQRFYRGDRARQRAAGSSGLGLAIVTWIVEAHGGTVQVDSRLGEGTTLIVRLRPAEVTAGRLLTGA